MVNYYIRLEKFLATLIFVLLLNKILKLHFNKLLLAFMQFSDKICFSKPSPDIGPIIC